MKFAINVPLFIPLQFPGTCCQLIHIHTHSLTGSECVEYRVVEMVDITPPQTKSVAHCYSGPFIIRGAKFKTIVEQLVCVCVGALVGLHVCRARRTSW